MLPILRRSFTRSFTHYPTGLSHAPLSRLLIVLVNMIPTFTLKVLDAILQKTYVPTINETNRPQTQLTYPCNDRSYLRRLVQAVSIQLFTERRAKMQKILYYSLWPLNQAYVITIHSRDLVINTENEIQYSHAQSH